ncbi:related to CCCH zinc finger DNA binding protein [Cephalotrichum gorgonifer]|uniref:Related to CCCH zinc finger DNA binding protein n=1 Tax=Cephalotrichum gorgonifer TaxID=2041049 RepID=A0AAE8MX77_9PEZI|nr:related to CCCH zinc finger DNA binding protein [Cephalotrichum gorgonifer]
MSDLQERVGRLREGWDECKAHEDRKNTLVEDLFKTIDSLRTELSEVNYELAEKKIIIRAGRNDMDELTKQVRDLGLEKMGTFKDDLVKQGAEGGKRTAGLLKQAVEEELRSSEIWTPHLQVVARVYANMKGLGKVYKDTNILPRSDCLDEFIRGFNMGDAMCDYVDAGTGKECSDEKVKAVFKSYLNDVHCQRIFFGGSPDNGYARLLVPYLETPGVCERICLLEGPPFAQELGEIKHRFRTATFDDVFRSQKIPTLKRRVSWRATTPPATPSMDYATVASKPAAATSPTTGPSAAAAPSPATAMWKVQRNRLSQRVDTELRYSVPDFQDVKARRLCNRYHLTGKCPYQKGCYHEHGERLAPKLREALLAVARLTPCVSGLQCDDPNCTSGHRCPWSSCPGDECRFPREMHEVDTRVVS